MSMAKTIYVYENWSSETPTKLGTLYVEQGRGSGTQAVPYEGMTERINPFPTDILGRSVPLPCEDRAI